MYRNNRWWLRFRPAGINSTRNCSKSIHPAQHYLPSNSAQISRSPFPSHTRSSTCAFPGLSWCSSTRCQIPASIRAFSGFTKINEADFIKISQTITLILNFCFELFETEFAIDRAAYKPSRSCRPAT